ncbi:MAG: CbiX/SirB N-terminal domain-containing protein, partial [Akkermansiaceae bacterium]
GYFTQQVIPEKLHRLGKVSGKNLHYQPPVGTHTMITDLLRAAAEQGRGEWPEQEVSLLLVGHGSNKNSQSKETLLKHMAVLKQQTQYASIADVWLEEAPFVSDWRDHVATSKVLVLPYLLADGQHGNWDVPKMLGVSDPTQKTNHDLKLCPALGSSAHFADVIAELAG